MYKDILDTYGAVTDLVRSEDGPAVAVELPALAAVELARDLEWAAGRAPASSALGARLRELASQLKNAGAG